MNKKDLAGLLESARQMRAILDGKMKPARVTKLTLDHPRLVRVRLKLTRGQFAKMLGVPVDRLGSWEEGTRKPTGAAKVLFRIAAKHPDVVRAALKAG